MKYNIEPILNVFECHGDALIKKYKRLYMAEVAKRRPGDTEGEDEKCYVESPKIIGDYEQVSMTFVIRGRRANMYEFGKGKYKPLHQPMSTNVINYRNSSGSYYVEVVKRHKQKNRFSKKEYYVKEYTRTVSKKSRNRINKSIEKGGARGVPDWFMKTKRFKAYISSKKYNYKRLDSSFNTYGNVRVPNAILNRRMKRRKNMFKGILMTDYYPNTAVWSFNPSYLVGRTFGIPWHTEGEKPEISLKKREIKNGNFITKENPFYKFSVDVKKAVKEVIKRELLRL